VDTWTNESQRPQGRSLKPHDPACQHDLGDEVWAIAEVVQARLGGIKIARQQQRDDSQIANTVEPDLDEGSCQSAALPEEWIRADQIQPLQLRRLRGQKIEDLVLPCATLDDVAGIDASAASGSQCLGHATIAAGL
jgi:hypothetical protein